MPHAFDSPLLLAAFAFVAGSIATFVLVRISPAIGLVDHPGGRKAHANATPLVGGLAIFASTLVVAASTGLAVSSGYLLPILAILVTVGVWDDIADIGPRIKFAVQIAAASLMIWGAGVELTSVGDLTGWRPIGMSILAAPVTLFAIVGVVNSLNMIDGLDGLGGSVAFIAFAWYAAVALLSGLDTQFALAVIFCGAIAGFLLFNLRFPWQPRARTFLGDAGSLMLGFALGWYAIDLTQGSHRTFPPIAALWVLLLPLADCVSLMTRRLKARKSPFVADNRHVHHYLLALGFTHGQTLAILAGASAFFGAVGFLGWRLDVPEPVLFWPFFFGFFAYHYWIKRAWNALDAKREASGSLNPA
ncbi:MAG TPA: MraY family glycosyltransferase [Usitatibacter sp.]|jgi:UDP-GlcNAc:undecaprenyl-phosphate GlcNAc-1-phosphate transferase